MLYSGVLLGPDTLPDPTVCMPGVEGAVGIMEKWWESLTVGGFMDLGTLNGHWAGYHSPGGVNNGFMQFFLMYFHCNVGITDCMAEMQATDNMVGRLDAWLASFDVAPVLDDGVTPNPEWGFAGDPTAGAPPIPSTVMGAKYATQLSYDMHEWDSYFASRNKVPEHPIGTVRLDTNMHASAGKSCTEIGPDSYRYTACLRYGDSQDVDGNRDSSPGYNTGTWTMPMSVITDKDRALTFYKTAFFYKYQLISGYLAGGAVNDVADDATAIGPHMRRAATTLVGWSDPWVMEYIGSDGGPCFNHDGNPEMYGATAEEWGNVYWGTNYPRLKSIKDKYDPDGRFNSYQGIGWRDTTAAPDLVPGCGHIRGMLAAGTEASIPMLDAVCKGGCMCDMPKRNLLFASTPEGEHEHGMGKMDMGYHAMETGCMAGMCMA
jgi:hypothetical protein